MTSSTVKLVQNAEDMLLTADLMELNTIAGEWLKLKPDNEQVKTVANLVAKLSIRMTKLQQERNDAYYAVQLQREQKLEAQQELREVLNVAKKPEEKLAQLK